MEREFSYGRMEGNTRGIGKMASSMELGIILGKTANRGRADGLFISFILFSREFLGKWQEN